MFGWLAHRRGVSAICAISLLFALRAFGAHAYLSVVGPPPLRVSVATTNLYVFDPSVFAPKIKLSETNSEAPAIAAAASTNTANVAQAPAPVPVVIASPPFPNPSPVIVQPMVVGQKNPPQNFNFGYPTPSASDLLPVPPQMITDYLKPDRADRNGTGNTNSLDQPGAVVLLPAELQFTPPAPQNAPESRAVYRSQ